MAEPFKRTPCAYDNASCVSRLFFIWVWPFLSLGSNVDESTLPAESHEDEFEAITKRLCLHWNEETKKPHPSLARALFKTFWHKWAFMFCLELTEAGCKILSSCGIWWLLQFFMLKQELWKGYVFSVVLIVAFTGSNLAHHHLFFRGWRLGMRLRQTFLGLLFDKAMRLRLSSLGAISVGAIVNLASNDIERFQQLGPFGVFLATVPFVVIASAAVGIVLIGPAFAAGYLVLLLLLPLQYLSSRIFGSTRRETARQSDLRIKLTAQAITGARLMKMQAWELAFLQRIGGLRARELRGVAKANYARSFNFALLLSISALMSFVTFVVHVKTGGTLRIPDVFLALSLYSVLQNTIFIQFANGLQSVVETRVSLQRITKFLFLPEADPRQAITGPATTTSQPLLRWENKSFAYAPPAEEAQKNDQLVAKDLPLVLSNVSFSLMPGEFVVIVGPVGAGKTSFLLAMLGELYSPPDQGSTSAVEAPPPVTWGLAPQQPWIYSGSIRENILLGSPFDAQRYHEVISACCLQADLNALTHGDMTRVGDRGVALSGGQRARVGLARLCYAGLGQQSDHDRVFLLDDPLSAVDPAVASALFKNVFAQPTSLLGKHTRVLVTHQLQFLSSKDVSRIVVLSASGHVLACDTYENLQGTDVLKHLMTEEAEAHGSPDDPHVATEPNSNSQEPVASTNNSSSSSSSSSSSPSDTVPPGNLQSIPLSVDTSALITNNTSSPPSPIQSPLTAAETASLLASSQEPNSSSDAPVVVTIRKPKTTDHAGEVEERDVGAVSWATYWAYIRSAGFFSVLFALLLFLIAQALAIGTSFWLGKWAAKAYPFNEHVWIGVFGGLTAATAIMGGLRASFGLGVCITASKTLHDTALTHVFRAPIAFFDMCPLGRILNRFSKDLGAIDDQMPYTILDFFNCVLTVIGAVILSSIVNPFLLIFYIPLMLYFAKLRSYYLRSSREVKRLEAASRSPIYSYFGEVLDGLVVIRAFGVQPQFRSQFGSRVNANTRAFFQFLATSRWLGFNLDVLTFFLVAFGSLGTVVIYHVGVLPVDNALLGVSLLYLIQLGGLFQWCVRQSTEVENQMVSVERVVSYGRLAPEAALEGPSLVDTEAQQGVEIAFRDVTCRYRAELTPVLKQVSVTFPSGARCAIVGRTGAGKSSIVEALFRLMENEGGAGTGVYFNNQPTAPMGLHPLRRLIGAIPQTPFLFAGSVRDNLDPLNRHSDEMLWTELKNVQMVDQIKEAGGLSAEVGEGGGMLSVGERQLLCLARALLQKPKILVLDEATANVDMKTDEMIQRALRTEFRHSTVLVIAHRLNTIIDCDLVLVLDHGRVVEVGSPLELLQKYRPVSANSDLPEAPLVSFARMVGETGAAMEQLLRDRAQQAANMRAKTVQVH